jgi:hypothetical protein
MTKPTSQRVMEGGLLGVAAIAAIIGVIWSAMAGYKHAEKEAVAKKFCASVDLGEPTANLLERANRAGAEAAYTAWVSGPNGANNLRAQFTYWRLLGVHAEPTRFA